ncbi:methylmalonyl-CoA mutase [Sphaerisporangium melleum]|uniref:methylmalonyl-CoA mutase n=1 Tax=Sphaerisporangium melleum TaxID=321316 RepID=A0A917RKP9_9ACTN|nr:methylmalonyl-CoA mutase family protein [Sphaerisporangium melleum]GGL12582.1 methylmalonyl-CoA mutase [Sphaerisporangium melleum]GII74447.1 methylmalonyl-CoA mutase [Sphaerisporangium melleum]
MTVHAEEFHPGAGFPPGTREEWRRLALEVLRKSGAEVASPEEALAYATYDGVTVRPLYDASDLPADPGPPGFPPFVRGTRAVGGALSGWDVRQRHAHPDPAITREAVLADLENGGTSLWLVLGEGGLDIAALPEVLDGVYLDLAPVVLDAGAGTARAADAYLRLADARGTAPAGGNLGADPIGLRARTGAPVPLDEAVALARRVREIPALRAITVDATPYHDAGGSDAEELGCSLATGVAYLRALTDGGLSVQEALGQVEFRYAATADQFLTIAKFRAARLLWARVAEACGAPGHGGQVQHAVTSSAMMTARDPYVNMLRTTLACFGAGVGGAEAITVQPFDARLGLPDAFARRIARNTHALLVEEAHVARVADPAGGSWYVERLTADLAAAAWEWFQAIEAAGGAEAALERLIPERLAATRDRRSRDIARRTWPITGVSEFPLLDERRPVRRPAPEPATGGLPRIHYAQGFEALRDRADRAPERPLVFLATIGPVAAHTARATFAANLFQAGGIATVAGGATTDPAQIAEAFTRSGAAAACLCSGDKLYAEHAAAVAAALAGAGARKVWLAGKGHYEGVDATLYAGCDALDVLRTTFDDLGVAP